ncbi:MAG TPA: 5'-3' exonuclease H3TH domain-containing protein [Polyangiaceae bacterium]|nr:5'-3' exonuclease H3TH domain-containing protein [Polyangiaceae bacterium]
MYQAMPRVALFDTHAVFFRAFHALPPMNSADGAPTSALYGFSVMLLKVLREHGPDEIAFAVDLPRKTFRHERFAAYKAHRARPPTPLVQQLERLPDLLSVLGVPVLSAPGFEADDVLATVAEHAAADGRDALVVTGDRDLLQLARDSVRVLFIGVRGQEPVVYDGEAVRERFGFPAANLPTLIALAGDKSDNIPGVPGIGDRTAKRLVREFGTVDGLLENLDSVRPEKLRALLDANREQLAMNETLSRLRTDVDVGGPPYSRAISREGFARLREEFERFEFKSLLPRLDALVETRLGPAQERGR